MPSMSIFSKKSKPKEPEEKSKKPSSGSDGIKQEQRGAARPPINTSAATQPQPLSPAERTVQRAQLMAASRKRMNMDGDSANGSFSSSKGRSSHPPTEAARRVKVSEKRSKSVKTPSKTLVKAQKPSDENKKKEKPQYSATSNPAARSAPGSVKGGIDEEWAKMGLFGDVSKKKPPVPKDSPTLGYTPEQTSTVDQVRSQPSADSGYGSVPRSSANNSRNGSEPNTMQDARSDNLPRVDSGITPKVGSGKEAGMSASSIRRSRHEDKSLLSPATKLQSKVQGYVSRLDPGPSGSEFSSPVGQLQFGVPRPKMEKQPPTDAPQNASREKRPPLETNFANDRGRSTTQKPVYSTAPSSPTQSRPKPQYAQPARSHSSSSRKKEAVKASQPHVNSTATASANKFESPPHGSKRESRTYTLPTWDSARRISSHKKSVDAARPSDYATTGAPRFADGTTLQALQALPGPTSKSTPRDSVPMPREVPNVVSTSQPNSQTSHSSVLAASNHQQPASSNTSNSSTRRPTLPPVSALEGYKVNKRGQVLDEEGDVIGELFEGDLIDCVRQKINADGEVLDDVGRVVGRVRPIRGLAPVRYSQDSQPSSFRSAQTFQPPRISAMSTDRRESNASQIVSPFKPNTMAQTKSLVAGLPAHQVISPTGEQSNTFIAELDASAEVEAFPIIDHSEIFVPTFGSSTRSQSPSQLMKAELPANERRSSETAATAREIPPNREIPPLESEPESDAEPRARPKKWASRYFDQGPPQEPGSPVSVRRNSQSPAVQSPTTSANRASSLPASRRNSQATTFARPIVKEELVASPVSATAQNGWNPPGGFKAILGPTLEDLAEESPSRSISSASKAGRSTPNLLPESSKLSVAPPAQSSPVGSRRASLQMGSSGGSLAPGSRTSYQPLRRSPLGNYETTPPGSGDANGGTSSNGRSVSMRASASVPKSINQDAEDADDSAPAPDILRAKPRGKTPSGDPKERAKTVEKRKSRFSFMTGKKEAAAVAQ